MRARTQALWLLAVLMVLDTLPIPLLGLLLVYVVLRRPPWFYDLITRLYRE